MSKEIKFTNIFGYNFFPPKPAIKDLPEWYKLQEEYIGKKKEVFDNGSTTSTIKKCIPVFDAMGAGYILYSQVDVMVKQVDGGSYFSWTNQDAIAFHPITQADKHPAKNGFPYPKWNNPYAVKTALGYSSLFISPMHRNNNIFTILPGVVDTDTYTAPVNFPFVMVNPNWTGLIPAGTAIAQVIPFKRDVFKMELGNDKDIKSIKQIENLLNTRWFNKYKTLFWHRKEYK
jgi:hypothetical protein